jgi:hypothetical protein
MLGRNRLNYNPDLQNRSKAKNVGLAGTDRVLNLRAPAGFGDGYKMMFLQKALRVKL